MDMKVLHKISYGMYVICSKSNDAFNGQIANVVTQVTSEPAQLLVCINKNNLTHEYISKSRVFTVSILDKDTPMKFIGHFGFKSGRKFNKFKDIDYKTGETGVPIVLNNCLGYLECNVISEIDIGTHTGFIGKVTDIQKLSDAEPMTYAYYHMVKGGMSPESAPTYIKNEKKEEKEGNKMGKYKCTVCGYIYDPAAGDPDSGIDPGTSFEDLPEDWVCPVCGAGKDAFEKEE